MKKSINCSYVRYKLNTRSTVRAISPVLIVAMLDINLTSTLEVILLDNVLIVAMLDINILL